MTEESKLEALELTSQKVTERP